MNAPYTTVPKSMQRIQEEWHGFPIKYIFTVITLVVVSLFCVVTVIFGKSNGRFILLIFLVFIWFVFYKFLRTPKLMNQSWFAYQYILRRVRGQTMIAKYNTPATFLEQIVPIKKFHPDGLIEFTQKKYGLMIKADPARISDDELEQHLKKVRYLTDGLHGDLLVKTFVCSIPHTAYKPIEQSLIKSMNKQNKTEPQKHHLYSLYEEQHNDTKPTIDWYFYILISLGTYKSLKEATIAKQQYYPGFESALWRMGMRVALVLNKDELALCFRQCITQIQLYR